MKEEPIDLLAVDPSIASAGVALFRDGQLLTVSTVKLKAEKDEGEAARCARMAHEIVAWCWLQQKARPSTLAVEWPQWYTADKSVGDPNDLAGLAGVATGVACELAIFYAAQQRKLRVLSYKPAEWAGQLPKSKTAEGALASPRAARILDHLTEAEHRVWDGSKLNHDAIDAIGIGLKALGRFERRRMFPGATP